MLNDWGRVGNICINKDIYFYLSNLNVSLLPSSLHLIAFISFVLFIASALPKNNLVEIKLITCLNVQEEILKVDLEKPLSGGLGFSVIGGERGIFVKSITPGGVAETSGNLQVGDRLLKVSYVLIFMNVLNLMNFRAHAVKLEKLTTQIWLFIVIVVTFCIFIAG